MVRGVKTTPDNRFLLIEWYELHPRSSRWDASPMLATRAQAEEMLGLMQRNFPETLEIVPMYQCFGRSGRDLLLAQELEARIVKRGRR